MEFIGAEESKEVLDVLESGYLFRYGDAANPAFKAKVWTLEKEFAAYIGVKHALAVTSGTTALLTAFSGLGIGPGDEVIVPGYSFVASLSSIIYARAVPVLAEIDESLNLDPDDLEKRITPQTKAILAVHMLGNPAKMDEIRKIADKHGIPIVEDVAQSCGSAYHGKKAGGFGKLGIYSFNIYKTMTCGDGGMVVTDDDDLYARCFAFHDQGHLPNRKGVEVGARSLIGLDFRMNELTGAVALAQLRKLDSILAHLRKLKKVYKERIATLPGIQFREITDEAGECATLLTLLFKTPEAAKAVADRIGSVPLINSGWHVYGNMEQILAQKTVDAKKCPFTCPHNARSIRYEKGMLPKTEAILSRAVNLSVGLRDKGIGAACGLNPRDTVEIAAGKADEMVKMLKEVLG
ncbi:MAG: DegT/DnrJ/EryC1/StrS family aminotransferase [Verrucomicrobiae bacterium]|nr:DegT/DnrJ/EryC1/StrS family aminotransferase [Verrucomicrobiae bacterium]